MRQCSDTAPPCPRPTRAFPTVWHRHHDFSESDTNCVDIALVDSTLLPLLTLHRVGGICSVCLSPWRTLVARRIQPTATRDLTSIHLELLKRKQSTGSCRKRASVQDHLLCATPADSTHISPWSWPPIQSNKARPTSRQTPRPTRHRPRLRHCPTCPIQSKNPLRATTRLRRPLPRPTKTRTTRQPSAQMQKTPRDQGGRRRAELAMPANVHI